MDLRLLVGICLAQKRLNSERTGRFPQQSHRTHLPNEASLSELRSQIEKARAGRMKLFFTAGYTIGPAGGTRSLGEREYPRPGHLHCLVCVRCAAGGSFCSPSCRARCMAQLLILENVGPEHDCLRSPARGQAMPLSQRKNRIKPVHRLSFKLNQSQRPMSTIPGS